MGIGCVKVKGVYEYERRKSAKYELTSNQSTGSSQDKNLEQVWNIKYSSIFNIMVEC